MDDAREAVELAQEFSSEAVLLQYQTRVVGIDLSGDPKVRPLSLIHLTQPLAVLKAHPPLN